MREKPGGKPLEIALTACTIIPPDISKMTNVNHDRPHGTLLDMNVVLGFMCNATAERRK